MKVKRERLFFKKKRMINQLTSMSMKRSCRELSIDMVINKDIFKNKQITLFPSFNLSKQMGLPKTGASFHRRIKIYTIFFSLPEKVTNSAGFSITYRST